MLCYLTSFMTINGPEQGYPTSKWRGITCTMGLTRGATHLRAVLPTVIGLEGYMSHAGKQALPTPTVPHRVDFSTLLLCVCGWSGAPHPITPCVQDWAPVSHEACSSLQVLLWHSATLALQPVGSPSTMGCTMPCHSLRLGQAAETGRGKAPRLQLLLLPGQWLPGGCQGAPCGPRANRWTALVQNTSLSLGNPSTSYCFFLKTEPFI